jgi:hypothetical protein
MNEELAGVGCEPESVACSNETAAQAGGPELETDAEDPRLGAEAACQGCLPDYVE